MYKINTHNISGVRNYVNNPNWRVVMTNYVCYVKSLVGWGLWVWILWRVPTLRLSTDLSLVWDGWEMLRLHWSRCVLLSVCSLYYYFVSLILPFRIPLLFHISTINSSHLGRSTMDQLDLRVMYLYKYTSSNQKLIYILNDQPISCYSMKHWI